MGLDAQSRVFLRDKGTETRSSPYIGMYAGGNKKTA